MKRSIVMSIFVLAMSLTAQAGIESMTPSQMASLDKWWGDMSSSAAVVGDACQYTITLQGSLSGWGEEVRLVKWWNDYGFGIGDTWQQKFVSSADNPYSLEVKMYYTYQTGPDLHTETVGVINPGDELTLSLDVNDNVIFYGFVFVTSYWTGTHPTTEGATGTLVLDAYQVPEPATMSLLALGALTLLRRRKA